jgi:hypothetical protein
MTMNRISLAFAAVAVLAITTPLTAQTPQGGRTGAQTQPRQSHRRNVAALRIRLDTGIARGTITRREATTLRIDLNTLVRLGRTYGRDGFSRAERATLMRRAADLRWFIQRAEENGSSDRL